MNAARRGVLRWLRVLLAVLGGLLVLVVTALVFVMTPRGERWVKELAVNVVNQRLEGRLSVEQLDLAWDELELKGVRLLDPDGEEVLRVERGYMDVYLLGLFSGSVHVERLELENYQLLLQREPDEQWNLLRALSPSQPTPAAGDEEPGQPPSVRVDEVVLSEGLFELRVIGSGQHLRVEELDLDGALSYRNDRLKAEIELIGEVVRPRAVPLRLSLGANARDGKQWAQLDLSAGTASVQVSAGVPLQRERERPLRDGLEAELTLRWPQFEAVGWRYGPIELGARWARGALSIPHLEIELPGVSAVALARQQGVAVRIDVPSIERTVTSLEALLGVSVPTVAGKGRVELRSTSASGAGGLRVEGDLERLRVGTVDVSGVTLAASLVDWSSDPSGELELDVEELRLLDGTQNASSRDDVSRASTRVQRLSLRLERRRRQLRLVAAVAKPYSVNVDLGGLLELDRQTLTVERLDLRYPENHWTLQAQPALLSWADARLRLRDLNLRALDQRVQLDAEYGAELRGALVVRGFRLESIPEAWLPREARAAGVLDVDVKVSGAPESPQVGFALDASRLQWQSVNGAQLELAGTYRDARIQAQASATGLGATLDARIDAPIEYPPAAGTPIEVRVGAERVELERVWQALSALAPPRLKQSIERVGGRVEGLFQVSGTWPEPAARAVLRLEAGTMKWRGIERYRDVTLDIEATPESIQLRKLAASVKHGGLHVTGAATSASGDWDYGYEIDLSAERFPLPLEDPLLATATLHLSGRASLDRVTSKAIIDGMELRRQEPDGQPDRRQALRAEPRVD